MPDNGEALPLDVCFMLRDGTDVTLVSWGADGARDACRGGRARGRAESSAEVIDVATVEPLDMRTIFDSVAKTGRCVIVHEAARNVGVGAEIAAQLADQGLLTLLAPIKRVTGYDAVVPLAKLEHHYMPQADRIVGAVRDVLEAA